MAVRNSFLPKLLSSFADFAEPRATIDHAAFCQRLIALNLVRATQSKEILHRLASNFIRIAEHSIGLRDMQALAEVSEILLNLPLPEARQAGTYYRALVIKRRGQAEEAQTLLEKIADGPAANYRARAMQTLGVMRHEHGDLHEAGRFYLEAVRAGGEHDLITAVSASKTITAIKSANGDHRGALADLQDLWPLFRLVARQHPFHFSVYHNALAVEFGELGRIEEAETACAIALASPFAHAYPEYTETRDELAAKRLSATRSVVAINRRPAAAPLAHAEPEPKSKPTAAVDFRSPIRKDSLLQRTPRIAASATVPHDETTNRILDRVLTCIRSRAPPIPA
ncbi:MAG: hypothetical protein AABO41_09095 [Acidobacteriota bacterium]